MLSHEGVRAKRTSQTEMHVGRSLATALLVHLEQDASSCERRANAGLGLGLVLVVVGFTPQSPRHQGTGVLMSGKPHEQGVWIVAYCRYLKH